MVEPMLHTILLVAHVLLAAALIVFVLLQHGKGAEAGAAFGSGASATMFGAQGSASFMSRTTAILATGFFLTSLTLAYFATQKPEPKSVVERIAVEAPKDIPALPGATSAPVKSEVPQLPQQQPPAK